MKELTNQEMVEIKGGAITGALLEGIAVIIKAVTESIIGIGQLTKQQDSDHAKKESNDIHNYETVNIDVKEAQVHETNDLTFDHQHSLTFLG